MSVVLFDGRAAGRPQQTGWERYTGRLADHLASHPSVHVDREWRPAYRIAARWELQPWLVPRGVKAIHHPSFPPIFARSRYASIYTLHDLTWWRYPELSSRLGRTWYRPWAERAVRRAAVVIADSHAVQAEIVERWPWLEGRCEVVYPGIGLVEDGSVATDASPAGAAGADRPYFLSVGTAEPRRDFATLVEAYRRSGLSGSVDLVVVGRQGWGEPPPGLEIRSGVSDAELISLYQGALAVVCPSIYEGFGLPVIEANRHGAPVICTDIPVLREVSGGLATYYGAGDADELAGHLRARAAAPGSTNGSERERLRRHASTFTWEAATERLLGIYAQVTDG